MAQPLPYLSSNKNLLKLFAQILAAQKPSTFTHTFLQNTIGLKGTNDRPLIPLLRTLGFLDAANVPTSSYDLLKNGNTAKTAIAAGIRKAYEGLFQANERADELGASELKGLLSQVSGADEKMVNWSARTFAALAKLADFSAPEEAIEKEEKPIDAPDEATDDAEKPNNQKRQSGSASGLRTEFHYNIQIHLPGNGTEETYLNIFNAIRRTFK